jgi:hypothetical protein
MNRVQNFCGMTRNHRPRVPPVPVCPKPIAASTVSSGAGSDRDGRNLPQLLLAGGKGRGIEQGGSREREEVRRRHCILLSIIFVGRIVNLLIVFHNTNNSAHADTLRGEPTRKTITR